MGVKLSSQKAKGKMLQKRPGMMIVRCQRFTVYSWALPFKKVTTTATVFQAD